MNEDTGRDPDSSGVPRRLGRGRRLLVLPIAIMSLALIASACGGGSNGPSVAGAGSDTSTTGSQSSSGTGATKATSLKYSRCMRSHGISDFPDPNSSGQIQLSTTGGPGSAGDLDPQNPTFKAAMTACKAFAPDAGTATEKAARRADMLKYSQCMRSHGIADFPDPNADGGLQVNGAHGGDLDPQSPQFASAQKACQKLMPGGGKGGTFSTHSEGQ